MEDPARLPQARECELYAAQRSGIVARIDPKPVGWGIVAMGGGRRRMEDSIDHSVGFVIAVKPGDYVRAGEPLATIFARDRAGVAAGKNALAEAIEIAEEAEPPLPLISHRVDSTGVSLYEDDDLLAALP